MTFPQGGGIGFQNSGIVIANKVIIFGPNGGEFIYNASKTELLYSNVGAVGVRDPILNNIVPQGATWYKAPFGNVQLTINNSILSISDFVANQTILLQLENLGGNDIFSLSVSPGAQGIALSNIMFITPSTDTTGVADSTNIKNAFVSFNVVWLTPGTYYLSAGQVLIGPGQWLYAPGCVINATATGGAGDFIQVTTTLTTSPVGGGILGRPVIDGTSAPDGSAGIHAGDMFQLEFDCKVQNFFGTNSKNWWFDNRYSFTEQIVGNIWCGPADNGIVFDNSTGTTLSASATGSFDRFKAEIFLSGMSGWAISWLNGAFIVDGDLGVYGNMVTGNAVQTACMRLKGSNAGGFSQINRSVIRAGVELRNAGGNVPMTINFDTVTSNCILKCSGFMDFSANSTFTISNNYAGTGIGSFEFDGPIYGDTNLQRATNLGRQPYSHNPLNNGDTIFTKYTGLVRLNTTAGTDVTGIILQGFNPDDWRDIVIMNTGAAGSITFAAPGTSFVATGTACVIPPLTAARFHWSVNDSLWYQEQGPGAGIWQNITVTGVNFAVGTPIPQYRYEPDNNVVRLRGQVNATGATAAGATFASLAAFTVAASQFYSVPATFPFNSGFILKVLAGSPGSLQAVSAGVNGNVMNLDGVVVELS